MEEQWEGGAYDEPDEPPPQIGTGNWTDADVKAWMGTVSPTETYVDPGAPPDLDEQRRYVPDQLIESSLLDYGYRPEEAARFAQTPVTWQSGVDYGGLAPSGQVKINDVLATRPDALDRVLAHEFVHRSDQERPDSLMPEEDVRGLAANPDLAPGVAEMDTRTGGRRGDLHGFTYGLDDPAHRTTGVAEVVVNYALSRLPPEIVQRYLPEFTGADAPIAVRRMLEQENEQRGQAISNPALSDPPYDETDRAQRDAAFDARIFTPEQKERFAQEYRETPWWMESGTYDPSAPPPLFGPFDKGGDETFYDENGNLTESGRAMLMVR